MKKVFGIGIIIVIEILLIIYLLFFYKSLHIELIGDNEVSLNINSNYKDPGVKSCYGNLFKCTYIEPKVESNVITDKIGEYEIKYTIKYKNKSKSITRSIRVVDTIKPVIKVLNTPKVCKNGHILEEGYEVFDNNRSDIKLNKQIVDNKLIYTAIDSSGNETKKEVDVEFIDDKTSPVVSLKGNLYEYVKIKEEYSEPGFVATDNCEGDITDKVKIENKVDTSKPGLYTVSYSVSDKSGNNTTIKRYVHVYEKYKGETVAPEGKTIYLTFDDGPSKYTEEILDTLKSYNIKATFFVINNNYDNTLKREFKEGHTVALHSYTHNYRTIYSSVDSYFLDLELIRDKVNRITGSNPNIIRFPGGSSNSISRSYSPRIMTNLVKEVENRGYKYVDWNIDSGDVNATSATQIINNIKKSLNDNRINVILMHDTKKCTKDALKAIIEYGLANGYSFLPITASTPDVHHSVNN